MTGVFKANNPFNTFLLLVYGLLLKLSFFLHPAIPQPQQTDGFLFKMLLKWLQPFGYGVPAVYPIITFVLLYTQAVWLNKFCNERRLLQKPNYLVAMGYLLITSLFPEWNILSAPLIVNTILIWVWSQMSKLSGKQYPKTILFNIGIAIGISTFLYFPSIGFIALLIFGLIFTRPFNIAEWFIALLGIITPYYFLLALVFLTDKWQGYIFPGFTVTAPKFNQTSWAYTAIGIIVVIMAIGLFFVQQNFRRQLIQTRKSWNLIFLYGMIAIFIPFINATSTFNYWILCAVPISILMASAFFYLNQKWIASLLHWLIVAFILVVSYYT